ncbi:MULTISPECIES: histidine phosphatase family protein [Bacillaceae]|uniref:Histidine phosphatase family protein n=1 Tax=Evansella alkalicola TaxID=745819 RepID=A0ABS6JVW4_9BACI|nr:MULTISPECIES: histidine phosphatase family protein [Bacillaceae]MBU9722741.1 histidine phosphatase family protein [Bacillus alkalicola]
MTTIGLIRHGVTEWNSLGKAQGISDIPLNELGRKQALDIGIRLSKEEKWDMIFTSDLGRAVETAQIIGSKIDINTYNSDERIREINCGKLEGTTEEERVKLWGSDWRNLDLGMEKHDEVANRGIGFLQEIVKTYKGKRLLVISHGALIGLTLQQLLPEKYKKTKIDNTALTILNHSEGTWDCSLYNCTKHLK